MGDPNPRGGKLFAIAVLAVLGLDQLTKALVASTFDPGEGWPAPETPVGQVFRILRTQNTGVAFGLFQGRNELFILVALAVVGGLVVYQSRLAPGDAWLRGAFGLQVGGALGNIVDRLRLGHVTDFLDFRWEPYFHWPTFNVADSAIVVGVVILTWRLWRHDHRHAVAPGSGADPVAAAASFSVPPASWPPGDRHAGARETPDEAG